MEKNVLLGICGGISSYKTCELVRLLIKSRYSIKVMMTEAATKFVSPLVFQELSQNTVYLDMFQLVNPVRELGSLTPCADPVRKSVSNGADGGFRPPSAPSGNDHRLESVAFSNGVKEANIRHIGLCQWASLCVIAPLSANTLSKIATGVCDNLLTTVVCALPKEIKVLLVPAMNENMWRNPILQDNVKKLKRLKKYIIMPPQKGELACGIYGEGRMAEPREIYKKIKSIINSQ